MMLQKMGLTIYDIAGAGLLALLDYFGVADCNTACGRKLQKLILNSSVCAERKWKSFILLLINMAQVP